MIQLMDYSRPRFRKAELRRRLRARLKGRVTHAFLFGSYANNTADGRSDVDLALVVKTRKSFWDRHTDFEDIILEFSPVDLLIYTPEEWVTVSRNAWAPFKNAEAVI
ncbi:MAG: nucleotidyltransferase domain-containing protein [Myxococcaceae bacterium]